MNEEELKAGERYNFTLLYTGQSINNKFRFESPTGIHYILGLGDMEAVSPVSVPSNGIKNTEPTPKYDPCRKFRNGDRVRVVEERNDRIPPICGRIEPGKVYTVSGNEDGGDVMLEVEGKYDCISWLWLDLVTPVEELEPYSVVNAHTHWDVTDKDMKTVVTYSKAYHPHAKEAAEAECARLNAEYRKEMDQ